MNLSELMKTKPENLAELQHKQLKEHVLSVLSNIQKLVEEEQYDSIEDCCGFSGAGDGYGSDNHYIDFSYNEDSSCALDILDVADHLSKLKRLTQESGG